MGLLTINEVAERLKVDDETVRRWLQSGKLKGCKVGGKLWRIDESDLEEFLKSGK